MSHIACPVCLINIVNGCSIKKPWKTGASSGHIRNLKQSIFNLSLSMVFVNYIVTKSQQFSMFAVLQQSDINSFKSGLHHLTSQHYCKKCRLAKMKDGIRNLILRNYLVDRYTS